MVVTIMVARDHCAIGAATIARMRTAEPRGDGAPLQRSVTACIAAILEVDVADVPVPEDGHPQPWTVWRNWLNQRGVGLVPIAEPARFNWPGPWLAVLRGGVGVVAFGAPPGIAWHPLEGAESFDTIERGYLIAPADVALWSREPAAAPRREG